MKYEFFKVFIFSKKIRPRVIILNLIVNFIEMLKKHVYRYMYIRTVLFLESNLVVYINKILDILFDDDNNAKSYGKTPTVSEFSTTITGYRSVMKIFCIKNREKKNRRMDRRRVINRKELPIFMSRFTFLPLDHPSPG